MLTLSGFALTLGFASCATQKDESSQPQKETYTVEFVNGTGFTYVKDSASSKITVEEGETVSFSLDIGAFYAGTPLVLAGDRAVASADGVYTWKVTEDTTISVQGIQRDVSSMPGTGSFEDAFVVSRPIDLLFIAEKVNEGDTTYTQAAYVLANDIDCKGETLEVIGNLNTDNAFFSGCFSCYTDSETNEATRYTISNFKINATDTNYVGLFGCVQANPSIDGSGLFYGIRLDNYTINASTTKIEGDPMLYCGSLIGYGVGVQAYLCEATNGQVNVFASDNYFAYAGGLMGCQQGYYAQEYGQSCPSEIAYATVDVDVAALQGTTFYGGGIVGYALTDMLTAPAFIHNSYATGNVSGASRAGGIAGGLGQYTSVSNCYFVGDVSAYCPQSFASIMAGYEQYCYAYAGGIVGYAENDSVINENFSCGYVYAQAVEGDKYAFTGNTVADGDDKSAISVNSEKYVEINNLSNVSKTEAATKAQETLGWREHDWIFTDGEYPVINYEPSEGSVATVLKFTFLTKDEGVTIKVAGETGNQVTYEDSYAPIVDAFNSGSLDIYLAADNGYLSYGYFFDRECTKPVPYAYLSTAAETEIFVAFADPTAVVGSYALETDKGVTDLELTKDGNAIYTDGDVKQTRNYQFDGTTLLIENAKFTKGYLGAIDTSLSINGDMYFDMNRYNYFNYYASLDNGNLKLYDGAYYTKESPIVAYNKKTLTNFAGNYYVKNGNVLTKYVFSLDGNVTVQTGNQAAKTLSYTVAAGVINFGDTSTLEKSKLTAYDLFKGVWTKHQTLGKSYTLDGIGEYTYTANGQTEKGTYIYSGDMLTLSSGATVRLNSEGFLAVTENGREEIYYSKNSLASVWKNKSVTLTLYGLNGAGIGEALVEYVNGITYTLVYETSATTGYNCLYLIETAGAGANAVTYKTPFGYFFYNEADRSISATLLDPYGYDLETTSGYGIFTLALVDDYVGEWISADELFGLIRFDGNGFFDGKLTIDGVQVDYTLGDEILGELTLNGSFIYNGAEYLLAFDENMQIVTITDAANTVVSLERKDALADTDFVAFANGEVTATYAFDGKGVLTNGGSFTYTPINGEPVTYLYKSAADGFAVYTESVSPETKIGSIVKNGACYLVTITGKNARTDALYVRNELMGDWALNGLFDTLVIGPTDLNGNVAGSYCGINVTMRFTDPGTLTFSCEIDNMPVTYYAFLLVGKDGKTNGIALSEYASLAYNNYTLCAKKDAWYGKWTQTNPDFSMEFDGASFADIADMTQRYANGVARLTYLGEHTLYNYRVDSEGDLLMWSQEMLLGSTIYYTLVKCEPTETGAYCKDGKAYKRVQVDSLFKATASDGTVSYVFNGGNVNGKEGTLTASNGKTYSYQITEINSLSSVATLLLKDKTSGQSYTATLDYSNSAAIKITLSEATETV